ncbi:unnamed protein product [Symbiodinium sp. CCMP2456]|nr:unnamed protein product [Symbiodinium sp. CCMP2456]
MQSKPRFGPRPLYFEKVEDDEDIAAASLDEAEVISLPDFVAVQPRSFDDEVVEARRRVDDSYEALRAKVDGVPALLEAVDVDGWQLERSQFELVEEVDEDLKELQILLGCCRCPGNRLRLEGALREFEVSLRAKRTWAWFPLKRYEWSGYQYQEPVITLDFHVPGAGALSKEDIHCDFGADHFDLKIWNVEWPEDPGVKYHHRVRKTRLMRDIEPQRSFVEAEGNHVYVKLQKVYDPRHGYCAWPDLAAGSKRKPFQYQEDAPDGGLMDFLEGEYEKYEAEPGPSRSVQSFRAS